MNKLTIFTNMAKTSSLIARMLIYKIWDFNARLATELKLVTDYVVFSKTEGFYFIDTASKHTSNIFKKVTSGDQYLDKSPHSVSR